MQTELQGISRRAQSHKDHRFGGLYSLLNEANLAACFRMLNKNAAPGVDGITYEEYGVNLETNIKNLNERLKKKCYKTKNIRRKYIPKGSTGKMRPLGIPALEDKIVQYGEAKILEAIFEADFKDFSYGYRPGIGAKDAIWELCRQIQFGPFSWVVEADIKGFFDNIDHEWLIKMLEKRVDDRAFIGLIRKWLRAGILEETGTVIHPVTGTPQGGIVSPVLANIYLHFVMDLWFLKVVKSNCKGKVLIIRYADDFVCLFQFSEEAEKFFKELPERLGKFKLKVAEDKTKMLRFSRFEVSESKSFEFLGFEFRWGRNRKGSSQVKRRTSRKKLRAAVRAFTDWIKTARNIGATKILKTLKAKYQGHFNYYGVHGNSKSINGYYEITLKILFKWLNRRSQRKSYNWTGFKDLLKLNGIIKPKIMEIPSRRKLSFA